MKPLMPTSAYGKQEHLYLVPPRNKLFLQKNSTSTIHETRYATTDMDHVLGVHVDSQNPNINDLLFDSFLNQLVGCFAKKRGQIHILLIFFGRNYVFKYCHLLQQLCTLSRKHNHVLQKLPDDKFDITTTLVENLSN